MRKGVKQKLIKKYEKENEENEENGLNFPCIIGTTFTAIICTCLLWLIIKYN